MHQALLQPAAKITEKERYDFESLYDKKIALPTLLAISPSNDAKCAKRKAPRCRRGRAETCGKHGRACGGGRFRSRAAFGKPDYTWMEASRRQRRSLALLHRPPPPDCRFRGFGRLRGETGTFLWGKEGREKGEIRKAEVRRIKVRRSEVWRTQRQRTKVRREKGKSWAGLGWAGLGWAGLTDCMSFRRAHQGFL